MSIYKINLEQNLIQIYIDDITNLNIDKTDF